MHFFLSLSSVVSRRETKYTKSARSALLCSASLFCALRLCERHYVYNGQQQNQSISTQRSTQAPQHLFIHDMIQRAMATPKTLFFQRLKRAIERACAQHKAEPIVRWLTDFPVISFWGDCVAFMRSFRPAYAHTVQMHLRRCGKCTIHMRIMYRVWRAHHKQMMGIRI